MSNEPMSVGKKLHHTVGLYGVSLILIDTVSVAM